MRRSVIVIFAVWLLASTGLRGQTPLNSEFTYQGQLRAPELPSISTADFQFSLFDAADAGAQIGSLITKSDVSLSDGLFNVTLNFGPTAFQGESRWMEIAVRSPAGSGAFTTLSPRQKLTASPNASFSIRTRGIDVSGLGDVQIGTPTTKNDLTVTGDLSLGLSAGEYRHLRVRAANTAGFLFSSFEGIAAKIYLGFNHFINEAGEIEYIHPGGTSRLGLGSGSITFSLNPDSNQAPIDQLVMTESGSVFQSNVGVGVQTPDARLHVKGPLQVDVENSLQSIRVLDGNDNYIWTMGKNALGQPALFLVSPVTTDLEAGFYRDDISGNGVMFADDKNFRAPNPADASTDIWYCCQEGPEAAMYVRGTAQLINGRATIELPDHFRNLAFEPGMTVQLTPLSIESKGLAIIKKGLDGIEVGELGGGSGNYELDWRVEAVRKGWEDYKVVRPWMQSDPDADKAWRNRMKWFEERRGQGKPAPESDLTTPRPR